MLFYGFGVPVAEASSWRWDILPPVGLTVIITTHFMLIRPRWPVIAQGYLEPWKLELRSEKHGKKRTNSSNESASDDDE